jgi:hypothetical protein
MTARERRPQGIAPGTRVEVRMSLADRDLIAEHSLGDTGYVDRLRPAPDGEELVGEYTLDDLEDLLGYLSFAANHAEDDALQETLDALCDRLAAVQRSYDDGLWQDSGI